MGVVRYAKECLNFLQVLRHFKPKKELIFFLHYPITLSESNCTILRAGLLPEGIGGSPWNGDRRQGRESFIVMLPLDDVVRYT